jgi:hypothetical protein
MIQDPQITLEEAEQDVQDSTRQLEDALNQLKEKVDGSVEVLQKFLIGAKNPAIVLGIAVLVGVFFGQALRISMKKGESKLDQALPFV